MTITISAIIPAYNAERTIAQAIESLQNQILPPLEIIVVDDGSRDATAAIVRQMATTDTRITLITQPNAGGARARLAGYDAARAEALYFLDADDVALPNALQRLEGCLRENPQAVLCYGQACMVADDLQPIRAVLATNRPSGDVLVRQLMANQITTTGCVLLRKAALDRATMDHRLRIGQDLVMWAQLAASGSFTFIGGAPIMLYRKHETNVTHQNLVNPSVYFEYIDWIFSYPPILAKLSPRQQQRLRRRRIAATHSFIAKTAITNAQNALARAHAWQALCTEPLNVKLWLLCAYSCSGVRSDLVQRHLFR